VTGIINPEEKSALLLLWSCARAISRHSAKTLFMFLNF